MYCIDAGGEAGSVHGPKEQGPRPPQRGNLDLWNAC